MEMSLEAKLRFWVVNIQNYIKNKSNNKITEGNGFAIGIITGLLMAISDVTIMIDMKDRINFRDIVEKYKINKTNIDNKNIDDVQTN